MTTENQDGTVPAATLAGLFDCDERTIRALTDKGIVVKAGRGRYAVGQSVRNYVRHLRSVASGRDGATESLTAARTRLAQAKAAQAEAQIKIDSGELVRADDVEKRWSHCFTTIRRVVMGLPSRIVAELNLTRADSARIDQVVRDALDEAADEIGADRYEEENPAKGH